MYQVVASSPRTAEAGTGQGPIAPWPPTEASALSAPAPRHGAWLSGSSPGQVSEMRGGGGWGDFSTATVVAPVAGGSGCAGTREATCASVPIPSHSTSEKACPRVGNGSSP